MIGVDPAPGTAAGLGPSAARDVVSGAAVAAAYLALAHVPLGGGWPPAAAAILASLAFPRLAAPLCVAACMVHDAPGLVPVAARVAVAGCGLVHLVNGGFRDLRASGRWLVLAVGAALAAVLVAACVSAAGWLGWGFEQSPSRPWALVAAADVAMVTFGACIGSTAARDAVVGRRLAGAACAGLLAMAARIAGQFLFGPVTGFSETGAVAIASAAQLTGQTASGVVRYVGPMLTPNAMAMTVCFAVLVAWPRLGRGRTALTLGAAVIAIGAAVLGGTKSSLLVALVLALVLPGPVAGGLLIGVLVAWLWMDVALRDWIITRFRAGAYVDMLTLRVDDVPADAVVGDVAPPPADPPAAPKPELPRSAKAAPAPVVGVSVRERSFGTDRAGLRASDALLGMGLSHWPVYYMKSIRQPMADPHTAIFSYLWTYGVVGVIALGVAVGGLLRALRDPAAPRAIALVLLSVLLARDMFAIPLLIGTTSLTLLLWILIAQVVGNAGTPGAPRRPA